MARGRIVKKSEARVKRSLRVRKHLRGSAFRPRLSVVKSNKHLQAQIIDDEIGVTLVGLSTCSKELKATEFSRLGIGSAREIGRLIATRALGKGIERVVLDRGHRKYHGIIAALADAAREAGLQF